MSAWLPYNRLYNQSTLRHNYVCYMYIHVDTGCTLMRTHRLAIIWFIYTCACVCVCSSIAPNYVGHSFFRTCSSIDSRWRALYGAQITPSSPPPVCVHLVSTVDGWAYEISNLIGWWGTKMQLRGKPDKFAEGKLRLSQGCVSWSPANFFCSLLFPGEPLTSDFHFS